MGWFDFSKKKKYDGLVWTINSAGEWVFPNDKADDYIKEGYKSLPNVYSVITMILQKSTIVPFEIFTIKNDSKYRKYKATIANAKEIRDYSRTVKLKAESLEKVENSEIEKLLSNPNDYQSTEQLWWETDGYKLLTGNSILYGLPLVEGGKPKELHSIPSPCVELKVKGTPFDPVFKYHVNYLQDNLPEEDILHFKNWNPVVSTKSPANQYWGQSPLMACRRLLGRYRDADETQGFMFKNQGPGGLLTGEKDSTVTIEQAQMVADRFKQQHMGTHNANDIIVTPAKLSWTSTGLSPVDLNITEGKHEMLGELCNAYHVPIGMFSDKNSTENNMVEGRKALITDAVIPLVEGRKGVLQRKLLPKFGDNLVIEFDYTVFSELQEDLEKLAKTASQMYWVSPNEKRQMTGYDVDPDPAMDKKYFPSGLTPLEDLNMNVEDIDENLLSGIEKPTNGVESN